MNDIKALLRIYEEMCKLILDIELESLRNNREPNTRVKMLLTSANEFKDNLWDVFIHDINTKNPYA